MNLPLIIAFAILGATVNAVFITKFEVSPGQSGVLKSPNANATVYSKCGEKITTPEGLIAKVYERGTVKNGEKCRWEIIAPEDKIVNIDLLSFSLENDVQPVYDNSAESTVVGFYDLRREQGAHLVQRFYISPAEKIGRFAEPIRGKYMVIQIEYRNLKDFSRQRISINYSLVNDDNKQ